MLLVNVMNETSVLLYVSLMLPFSQMHDWFTAEVA